MNDFPVTRQLRLAMLLHNRYCVDSNCDGIKDFMVDAEEILELLDKK